MTIVDNDVPPEMSIQGIITSEDSGQMVFTVNLSRAYGQTVSGGFTQPPRWAIQQHREAIMFLKVVR